MKAVHLKPSQPMRAHCVVITGPAKPGIAYAVRLVGKGDWRYLGNVLQELCSVSTCLKHRSWFHIHLVPFLRCRAVGQWADNVHGGLVWTLSGVELEIGG